MADATSYSDILRAIGLVLDSHGAHHAEIVHNLDHIDLSWTSATDPEGERSTSHLAIKQVRESARRLRGSGPVRPDWERSELLRTLGQELDQHGIALGSIAEDATGYRVRGSMEGREVEYHYTLAQLRELSNHRRAMRLAETPSGIPDIPRWKFWQRRPVQ